METQAGSGPLTFAIVANHSYFYDSPRVARALAKRRPHDFEALKRDIQANSTPDASEWLPLDLSAGLPDAGHYAVAEEEIDETRAFFLRSVRHPRVTLKDATTTKALRYTLVRGEGPRAQGVCPYTHAAAPCARNPGLAGAPRHRPAIPRRGIAWDGVQGVIEIDQARARARLVDG